MSAANSCDAGIVRTSVVIITEIRGRLASSHSRVVSLERIDDCHLVGIAGVDGARVPVEIAIHGGESAALLRLSASSRSTRDGVGSVALSGSARSPLGDDVVDNNLDVDTRIVTSNVYGESVRLPASNGDATSGTPRVRSKRSNRVESTTICAREWHRGVGAVHRLVLPEHTQVLGAKQAIDARAGCFLDPA